MRQGPSFISRAALCAALLLLNINAAAPVVAPQSPAMVEAPAAVVNDEVVTRYALLQRIRLNILTNGGTPPSAEALPLLQEQTLNQIIEEILQRQELLKEQRERKIKSLLISDKELEDAVAQVAANNQASKEVFLRELGGLADTFKEYLRTDLSWDNWIRGIYRSRLAVSEQQVDQYERTLAAKARLTQYLVDEILLEPARITGGEQAILASAPALVAQVRQGQVRFEALANQYSSAASAPNGGVLGGVTLGELPPEVDAVLTQMRPGEVSDPIRTSQGYYIIRLRAKREPSNEILATLKQVQIPLPAGASAQDEQAARARLTQVRNQIAGCSSVETAARRVSGVSVSDLGETNLAELLPVFRDGVVALNIGQASQPLRSEAGLHVLVVCAKREGGEAALTRDEIRETLFDEQLALTKRRAIRDLRSQATIFRPQ